MPKLEKVIFPVAGMGTRFLPATKCTPKEMLPVVDTPLVQYATDEAVESGADTLIFITNRDKHTISDHFDSFYELEQKLEDDGKLDILERVRNILPDGVHRMYVTQPQALGLGHAVLCGKQAVGDESFGVILADDMITHDGPGALSQMARIHEETGCSILAVEEVDPSHTDRYGIVSTRPHGDRTEIVEAIVEKPDPSEAPSNLAVVGRYILTPRIFDLLENTPRGANNEIQLTDAIAELLKYETVLCYRFQGDRYDCGSKLGFVTAVIETALKHDDIADRLKQRLQTLISK